MADRHEVLHERLYLKVPRTERLRKGSAGRLRYLLSTGWRETERWQAEDYITVRIERSGHTPRVELPKAQPLPPRPPRQGGGPGGRPQGPGGRGQGPGQPGGARPPRR